MRLDLLDAARRVKGWLDRPDSREAVLVTAGLVTFPLFQVGLVRLAALILALFHLQLADE